MSDHEFEKKVQQKMDELRLRPSDAVWAEVDRNLRREKRRRRVIIWIPLMGILLTAGGYFIFTGTGNAVKSDSLVKTEKATEKPAAPASTLPSTSSSSSSSSLQSSPKNTTEKSTDNSTQPDNKHENISQGKKPASDEFVVVYPDENATVKKKPARREAESTMRVKESRKPDKHVMQVETNKKPLRTKTDSPEKENGSGVTASNDNNKETIPAAVDAGNSTVTEIKKSDSAIKTVTPKDTAAKKVPEKLIAKAPKKKQSSQSKWQWGVKVNGGMANISEGSLLDVLKSVRVDDLTNASPVYNGIPPVPSPVASPIRPGLSFSVGGFVQRKLSNRVHLSAGLQYSYFSMNTRVGRRVDSMLAVNYGQLNSSVTQSYYSGSNLHDYTNRYHFIELPVMASIHILGKKKMPVILDAGFSLSRLVNTNALHFDGISGVYYENDDFFKNMQVSLNGALNIGLLQNTRHPLFIGPNLRYFTTGLIKKEVTASGSEQHIWSFGLNAKMLLKK